MDPTSSSIPATENMERNRTSKFHTLSKRQIFNLLKNQAHLKMFIKTILVVAKVKKAVLQLNIYRNSHPLSNKIESLIKCAVVKESLDRKLKKT